MAKFSNKINLPQKRLIRALGLMSGTSMDGIDVAYLETDGRSDVKAQAFATFPYSVAFRKRLRRALGRRKAPQLEKELTIFHAVAVKKFLRQKKIKAAMVDLAGFHGHTLFHAPDKKITVQIGDGKWLAKAIGVPVIFDFRSADIRAGGEGAPLVPVYHQALAAKWKKPVMFLNIGGVANLTYVGEKDLLACDTGPGNAMLDDWMQMHKGKPFDRNGSLARKGRVDVLWVKRFLRHPYFKRRAPKSLDRGAFEKFIPYHLNAADGAATLTMMTVASICLTLGALPKKPREIVVCGGGRKNTHMMEVLARLAPCRVVAIEAKKANGDAIEAEAFAYMAVREALGLPVSFKGTTGRRKP
jgi:anhydro-N-acetylmuramic acid kinase